MIHQIPDIEIRRLVSPKDEWIDLSEEERQTIGGTQKPPSGPAIRRARPSKRGLLLIYVLKYHEPTKFSLIPNSPIVGFAISFPKSNRGEEAAVEYMVNEIYRQQELRGEV